MILLGLAVLIAATRLHTYGEPLDRDIATYAVIGHELRAGRALYADLWDHKPPAIYATYAAAEALVGYGPRAVYLLGVAAAVVTLLGVYAAGSAVGGRATGLSAAAFWALISGDLWLEANQPNAEVFLNACLVWAFALLVRADPGGFGVGRAVAVGLLFALGSLYKPVILPGAVLFACAHVALARAGCGSRREALKQVTVMAGVGVLAWAGVFMYFAAVGRLGPFYEAVVVFNRFYAEYGASSLLDGLRPAALLPSALQSTVPLAGLAALGVGVGLAKGPRRAWVLLLVFAAGTLTAIAVLGGKYPHYYQLWLPPLAVGAGWATGVLSRSLTGRYARLARLAGPATLVLVLAYELPLYRFPADAWSRIKSGEIYLTSAELGREIDRLLEPHETFYAWSNEAGLYFASRRRPLTGAFLANSVFLGPLAARLSARVAADLAREHPELFVIEKWHVRWFRPGHPVRDWFDGRYRPFPGNPDREFFVLFVRRGGKLEARLEQAAAAGPSR